MFDKFRAMVTIFVSAPQIRFYWVKSPVKRNFKTNFQGNFFEPKIYADKPPHFRTRLSSEKKFASPVRLTNGQCFKYNPEAELLAVCSILLMKGLSHEAIG